MREYFVTYEFAEGRGTASIRTTSLITGMDRVREIEAEIRAKRRADGKENQPVMLISWQRFEKPE
jgi:hypothetical protein